jgi:hypothetical protein
MRVLSRVALVSIVLLSAFPALADHLQGNCPLSLVGSNPPVDPIELSPHGVFRSGSQVFVLRGQTVSTYNVTDLGDMQVIREDFVGSLAGHESTGGAAFSNGYLYVSSEAGLEVFDLRNVRAGGNAPLFVSRTANRHYQRMTISGNTLVGLYPATSLPCYPTGTSFCTNVLEVIDISNPAAPITRSTISIPFFGFRGFNDIAFNHGFLVATGEGGTVVYNMSNPSLPVRVPFALGLPGRFLVSNGTNIVGVGNELVIELYQVSSTTGALTLFSRLVLARETFERSNPIMFHPQAFIDDMGGRIITMLDELDPHTLQPARTFAFDVFDLTVPMWEGAFERGYENVSYTSPDEVKYNPVAIGGLVYTVGEMSGLQTWGSCGGPVGKIEWNNLSSVFCGTTELRGWVTGETKTANVEVFLDGSSLGPATIYPLTRTDVSSKFPVHTWRIVVSFDSVARGDHVIRAVATDALGNRRQFASQRVFFPGGTGNCRRRIVGR